LSQYITLFIEKGQRDPALLAVGFGSLTIIFTLIYHNNLFTIIVVIIIRFDLDQWNRKKKMKKGQRAMSEADREMLVKMATRIFHGDLDAMCTLASLREYYSQNRNLFFELQTHAESVCSGPKKSGSNLFFFFVWRIFAKKSSLMHDALCFMVDKQLFAVIEL
jgi:hypothetical protein